MSEKSGSLVFAYFARPCAEDRELNEEDVKEIDRCIKDKIGPDISLLERCFPVAAGNLKSWSFNDVLDCWQYHHGHSGDCAVIEAMVLSISTNTNQVALLGGSKTFVGFNHYHFDLKEWDMVLVHRRRICHKL